MGGCEMEERKQAVALRYKAGEDAAPVVLAKGKGVIAEAIVELAKQAGIPAVADQVVEFVGCDGGGEAIPPEAYQLAAEVVPLSGVWTVSCNAGRERRVKKDRGRTANHSGDSGRNTWTCVKSYCRI